MLEPNTIYMLEPDEPAVAISTRMQWLAARSSATRYEKGVVPRNRTSAQRYCRTILDFGHGSGSSEYIAFVELSLTMRVMK